jgi:serine/threonine protein phosphatase 1
MPLNSWSPPKPQRPVYVVGDVHGCSRKLQKLLRLIDRDVEAQEFDRPELVFVGDYIDRGEGSADVLDFMQHLALEHPDQVTCLVGNHERMMLDFLDDPMRAQAWLRHGGLQTLRSFDVAAPASPERPSGADLVDAASDLRAALGPACVAWLGTLPTTWVSGDLWVVHAGADPDVPMDAQEETILLWGSEIFHTRERRDGQWVVAGHSPVRTPVFEGGRILIDTGAVYGGALSAIRITPGGDSLILAA